MRRIILAQEPYIFSVELNPAGDRGSMSFLPEGDLLRILVTLQIDPDDPVLDPLDAVLTNNCWTVLEHYEDEPVRPYLLNRVSVSMLRLHPDCPEHQEHLLTGAPPVCGHLRARYADSPLADRTSRPELADL